MEIEELATIAIDCGIAVHRRLGPGLLEGVYEKVLAHKLTELGLLVETQVLVPIEVDGIVIEHGYRADILIERKLLIEVKSLDRLAPVHAKQALTYLKFLDLPLGLLMNFGGETLRQGLQRVVNDHRDTHGSKLEIHQ